MIKRIKNLLHARILGYRNWWCSGSGIWAEIESVEDDANINDFIDIVGDRPLYLLPNRLTGGDYVDCSTTEVANHRAFLKEFGAHCIEVHGDFSYFGVAISVAWLCDPKNEEIADEILETLEGLEDYPVIDEEVLSEVEMELSDEAWECWAKGDFVSSLEKLHDVDFNIKDEDEDEDEDEFRNFFEKVASRTNENWQSEHTGMTINLDKIAEAVDLEELFDNPQVFDMAKIPDKTKILVKPEDH